MKNNFLPLLSTHKDSSLFSAGQRYGKITVRLLLLVTAMIMLCSILSANRFEDIADEYIIRPGDSFFIQIYSPIISLDSEEKFSPIVEPVYPVTITGQIILYPLTFPIKVAGLTLAEAKREITSEIRKTIPNAEVFIDLYSIKPYSIHLLGALKKPGEYVTDTLVTLYQALNLASGLSPAASKRINLTRQGRTRVFDLSRYLQDGDLSENPLVFSEDHIHVNFAEEFAKLYVVTDSINYVDYFEMETEKRLAELLPLIRNKYPYSDYQSIYIKRDGKTEKAEADSFVKSGDSIYLNPEESLIYVGGQVNTPDKFTYFAGKGPHYYISLAGGINRTGSTRTIHIISKDGSRNRYTGQELKEGDSIIIPVSLQAWVIDYLAPISTILSMITTIVVLTR